MNGGILVKERVLKDIVTAMKEKDKERLTVLRMVKGAMQLEEINQKKELTDEDVIGIFAKQIKTRKESITEFEKGNRQDLIDQTNAEIKILEEYMPEQLSEAEVDQIIDAAFLDISPESMKDMGRIMKEVTPKLKGKTDMSTVSTKIRNKLSEML